MSEPIEQRPRRPHQHEPEAGATAAEYVFLLVFIALIASIGMVALGDGLGNVFQQTGDSIDTVQPGTPGAGGGASN